MKIENYHCIKILELPSGWTEANSGAGFAPQSIRSFVPPAENGARIVLLNEGLAVNQETSELFRALLKSAPKVIWDSKTSESQQAADVQLINGLKEMLGNISNNQIVNTEKGRHGPAFALERLESLVLNGRPLLVARGWFCNAENGKQLTGFYGYFVDINPNDDACSVEQIYFEAEREDLYLQYLPVFEECLRSIEWRLK